MESLGNKLRSARESKGYTYDKVGDDIHIATRYLKALEAEEFSGFPGEPYILGFLKNYGEYLGLDAQELISLYKNMRIQEEPVPVEQLLSKRPERVSPRFVVGVIICLILLGALVGGVYFFFSRPRTKPVVEETSREPAEYMLTGGSLERRFYLKDRITVVYGEEQYPLELTNLGEAVTITTPYGPVMLDLSQEVEVDLTSDSMAELRITAVDFDKTKHDVGAQLRFELDSTLLLVNNPIPEQTGASSSASGEAAWRPTTGLANAIPIFNSPNAYPFTLQISFQGYCMFRWEILAERDRRDRNERYFQKADAIDIQAQNGIRMWASNAAMVKLQAIGGGRTVPLELGGAGEVVVADVRWIREDEHRYRLAMVQLE
ncbi:MAG: helix-turn-helix domain-containing protein [Treponema sp.]|jgi:cytoskeletal protein RodZ|nr:helix-turn-helix domain-containing protein [Treponema sp.]